jgi:hypothetical protein
MAAPLTSEESRHPHLHRNPVLVAQMLQPISKGERDGGSACAENPGTINTRYFVAIGAKSTRDCGTVFKN